MRPVLYVWRPPVYFAVFILSSSVQLQYFSNISWMKNLDRQNLTSSSVALSKSSTKVYWHFLLHWF